MTLFHISYDAKKQSDCDALRHDIPKCFLGQFSSIKNFTEPSRTTFRFLADVNCDERKKILQAMSVFSTRCYYFISASEAYLENGKSYFPSITVPDEDLNSNFKEILASVQKELSDGVK